MNIDSRCGVCGKLDIILFSSCECEQCQEHLCETCWRWSKDYFVSLVKYYAGVIKV